MRTYLLWILLLALAGCVSTAPKIPPSKMAEGYYMKGLSYLQERNYELASVEFNRSIQTDDKNKQAYYGLGIIMDNQGKFPEAQKYYEKALDLDPKFSEAYNALGVVHSKQRQWKDAIKAFNNALSNKLYTTPHIAYLNLGDVYMMQKEYVKAAEAYRESKRFVNLELTINKLGNAYYEAGKTKEAIKELQEGVSLAPQNQEMRYNLALAFLKDGNKKSAQAEFEKVVKLNPRNELALKANDYIKTLR